MATPFRAAVNEARDMHTPLQSRLDHVSRACSAHLPQYHALLNALAARLGNGQIGRTAPAVGEPFPEFALPDDEGRIVRLAPLLAKGPLAIVFVRGVWCGFCELHLLALAEALPAIEKAGGQLIAISPQRAAPARKHKEATGARFAVLCDRASGFAASLGLTAPIDEALHSTMHSFGIDLSAYNGDAGWTMPIPATFIIAKDGRVAAAHIDPDSRRRMEPAAIVQAVVGASGAGDGSCDGVL